MARSKTVDQLLLLFSAIVFISGLIWLITFLDARGVSERMSFFITFNNVFVIFLLTWQGYRFFRHAPRFWLFHVAWILVHIIVSAVWARSGSWIELCVLTAPLEIYLYFRIARYRLVRALKRSAIASLEGSVV